MTALNKQALIAKIKKQTESFDTVVLKEDEANALLDELETVQKTSAARLEAIDRTHKMFQREKDRADAAEKRLAEQREIVAAAEKLVRCKGRYHSELNYLALAKLFGVTTPDLPPLEHENVRYADAAEMEIAALRQRIAELQIARDKCFLSGLKTGWEYGIADDTEGYNREIDDAQEVIDRAAGIGVKGE
ncbi:ead/Ea22-like family protein [Citrobacter braakii]|uniref:ead/Ea22-like family protein n=1 Tax=Citrobacter braakii TaxID=57706 RepID=UPI002B249F75|nr:ead/Ea22-like family protein [Citrobacter braakii]MEB1007800.1 ead/Ea22-like family protein [Citrobacter braakii]